MFHKSRSANSGDEVIECERTRVHRAVLLGLIGSILGWADRKGDQWLCRRGDLVSQRRKERNAWPQASFDRNEGESAR